MKTLTLKHDVGSDLTLTVERTQQLCINSNTTPDGAAWYAEFLSACGYSTIDGSKITAATLRAFVAAAT
jgi:hypothetical protein